ncbi:MAG: FAD/NAD(P)-binding protein [Acidocella sp.]|nr:FAD/NAD(P)-binding protein [Acidocella sp.]
MSVREELRQSSQSVVFPPGVPAEARGAVAIIGGGFSGTITAIQLRRRLPPEQEILLIERSGEFARGLAYADTGAAHLLNVRAANMSAFPDDPGHFERWLEGADAEADVLRTDAGQFATRRLYGRYLQDTLQAEQEKGGGAVRLIRDEVTSLTRAPEGGWRLGCANGQSIAARGVVLACGNLPMSRPCDGIVHHNPWPAAALDGLKPDQPVLIIGTGLTMVDITLALKSRGFAGPVIALSRRGLLPQSHAPILKPWPTPDFTPAERASATGLWRAVRAQIRAAEAQGIGWRAVIDSLRPITAELWRGLPLAEQSRFLRHARAYWDVVRHRMAAPAAARLQALRENGELQIIRGRVQNIECWPNGAEVRLFNKATGKAETLAVQRVIYATGLQGQRQGTGLLAGLIGSGLARLDEHGFGLGVDQSLAVLDGQGQPQADLWALGPLVRGVFWECIAVPDIRVQANALGAEIAAQFAHTGA